VRAGKAGVDLADVVEGVSLAWVITTASARQLAAELVVDGDEIGHAFREHSR
jgi:hypothetical protein